jgi:hypothetical protein
MRQLEVIAVSDDGSFVLLAGSEHASRPTHQLRIDDRLHAALRGDLEDGQPRASELTPKEIQARLRAGATVEEVAEAAKVPITRVMRYAGPVISERDRVVEQARAAKLQRTRGPESAAALGAVVEQRLATTAGLRSDTVRWDARRRDDGAWIVTLSYAARGGSRTAEWLWQPGKHELSSLNSLATRLGVAEPDGAPRRRPATVRGPAKRAGSKRAAPKTAAKRAATARGTARRGTAKPPPKRTATEPPAAKRAAAKRAAPKPARPRSPSGARTAAAPSPRATPVRRRRAAADAVPAVAKSSRQRRATPPPIVEPASKRPHGRVPIPSWDDVLLGVQRPGARGRRRS